MKLKAIQIILEGLKVVFISFIISLILLYVDDSKVLHIILSIPVVIILLYILVEKSFISNKRLDYKDKVPSDVINGLVCSNTLPEEIEVTNLDKGRE